MRRTRRKAWRVALALGLVAVSAVGGATPAGAQTITPTPVAPTPVVPVVPVGPGVGEVEEQCSEWGSGLLGYICGWLSEEEPESAEFWENVIAELEELGYETGIGSETDPFTTPPPECDPFPDVDEGWAVRAICLFTWEKLHGIGAGVASTAVAVAPASDADDRVLRVQGRSRWGNPDDDAPPPILTNPSGTDGCVDLVEWGALHICLQRRTVGSGWNVYIMNGSTVLGTEGIATGTLDWGEWNLWTFFLQKDDSDAGAWSIGWRMSSDEHARNDSAVLVSVPIGFPEVTRFGDALTNTDYYWLAEPDDLGDTGVNGLDFSEQYELAQVGAPPGYEPPIIIPEAPPATPMPAEIPQPSPLPEPDPATLPTPSPIPTPDPSFEWLADVLWGQFQWLGDTLLGGLNFLADVLWQVAEWFLSNLRELLEWMVEALAVWFVWLGEFVVHALTVLGSVMAIATNAVLASLKLLAVHIARALVLLLMIVSYLPEMLDWLGQLTSVMMDFVVPWLEYLGELLLWLPLEVAAQIASLLVPSITPEEFMEAALPAESLEVPGAPSIPHPLTGEPAGPLPGALPPPVVDGSACGPVLTTPEPIPLTFRFPTPPESGCPGNGPGGARTAGDDAAGGVWGHREAVRSVMIIFMWTAALFVFARAMPWSRSRDDLSDGMASAGLS